MSTTILIILSLLVIIILYVAYGLFTMTLNDFLEKQIKKTLWLWLPFHAFKRLGREFAKKYFQ